MKKYSAHIASIILLLVFVLPIVTYAATSGSGIIPCDGVTKACDFNAFAQLINNVISWFLGISVSVAAITFTVAGARILLHPDQPGEREAGKQMFYKTAIGLIIILAAWLVIHTIIVALVPNSNSALRFLSN